MTILRRFLSIGQWILRRDRAERQLDDEMRTFVEMSMADKMREGVPPDQARRLAVLELGGIEQAKERVRAERHGARLDELGRDVRYAFRMFRKAPGFAFVVILTLALGIGANTAIFSLIDALILRWLPVHNPRELVELTSVGQDGGKNGSFSYPMVRAFAQHRDIFAGAAGFTGWTLHVGSGDALQLVPAGLVTGGFYDTLGLVPQAGRLLGPADDEPGAPPVAVISDGYWARQFVRSPDAVGRILTINGQPVTIVGVSPRGFAGATVGATADITITVAALPAVDPPAAPILGAGNFWLRVLARPAPGVTPSQAAGRLDTIWSQTWDSIIASHWRPSFRQQFAKLHFELTPGGTGWSYLRDIYRKPLMVLMAVVGLVLLIACANVAGLMLARGSARQREVAVRLAMGAGRGRIIRQLLTESALLSSTGAAFGILLAWFSGTSLVNAIATGPFQVTFDLTPNWHVLAFTAGVSVTTAMLFGLAPAFQITASGPSPVLKQDTRMSGSRSRLLSSLVCVQVALSLLLLVGAGLFVRTLRNLQNLDTGFNREGVLLVELPGRRTVSAADVLAEGQRVPGVVSASFSTHTPLSGSTWSDPVVPKGQPLPERDTALFVGAAPRFFETLQTPLVAGREFMPQDRAGAPRVAIVNEALAARDFPGRNPVGEYLTAAANGERSDLQIVGVVRDVKAVGLRRPARPMVYLPYDQIKGERRATIEYRVAGSLAETALALRRRLQPMFPDTSITVRPLSAQVDRAMVQERLMATLAGGFGVLALVLACVGVYGLLAYTVTRRSKEIGIRLALGAQRTRLIGMVLLRALALVVVGVALGVPAAWMLSRFVKSMLFGLEPADPTTTGTAVLLLATAALVAAYLPAWRASRVDPLVALRHE